MPPDGLAPLVSFADPLQGTDGGRPEFVERLPDGREIGNPYIAAGNCLPGPFLPFGLARPGPDIVYPQPSSGYRSDRPILRFTQTHVNGTGGGGRYGNIGLTPFIGPPRNEAWAYGKENETASPGAYAVRLQPAGIGVEITATKKCALYRFTFPASAAPCLLIDAGAIVMTRNWSDGGTHVGSTGGYIESGPGAHFGRGDVYGGYGPREPYSIFFHAESDKVPVRTWRANGSAALTTGHRVDGPDSRLVLEFAPGTHTIEFRLGISFVSVGHARRSLANETGGRSFDTLRAAAAQAWEDVFQRIRIEADPKLRGLFYTGFLRLLCMPSITGGGDEGENPFWRSSGPQINDLYCLWDSARGANQLIQLVFPHAQRDILNGLLDIAAHHGGWLPDAFFSWVPGGNQGGSTGDILFAEAALKNLGGVDLNRALDCMLRALREPSPDPRNFGRKPGHQERGWLTPDVKGNVSRQIEYAGQSAAAAVLATLLGRDGDAATFRADAEKVWNLWRDDCKRFNPRHADGAWLDPFDPTTTTHRYWENPHTYEGSAHAWSLTLLHDLPNLVRRLGGRDAFVAHLDAFFAQRPILWKEIVLHTPYLYHVVGRPERSAEIAREIFYSHYGPGPAGMPDNEDAGAQSAFMMWTILGLYPVIGHDLYLVSAPLARSSRIAVGETGATLEIRTDRDPADASCLVGVRLNGQALNRCWLHHHEIGEGGLLELDVSPVARSAPWHPPFPDI